MKAEIDETAVDSPGTRALVLMMAAFAASGIPDVTGAGGSTSRVQRVGSMYMSIQGVSVEENAALAYWPRLLEHRTKVATLAQCVLSINLRLI